MFIVEICFSLSQIEMFLYSEIIFKVNISPTQMLSYANFRTSPWEKFNFYVFQWRNIDWHNNVIESLIVLFYNTNKKLIIRNVFANEVTQPLY